MNNQWFAMSKSDGLLYWIGPCKDEDDAIERTRDCWIVDPESAKQWRETLGTDPEIVKIATECMESDDRSVEGWHKLAGGAAMTASNTDLDSRTRDIYRFEEAKALLQAVFIHSPHLSSTEMLQVAAEIAERANA